LKYAAVLFTVLVSVFVLQHFLDKNIPSDPVISQVPEEFVKEAPFGKKVQTKLPDGTDVWINSGSRLTYSENKVLHTRNVMLEGEAFFDVTKDASRPFVVKTQFVTVKALGTSFNVRAYKNTLKSEVTLLTGKVAVAKLKDTLSIIELFPGEKAVIDDRFNAKLKKQTYDYISDFGWKEGILTFQNADFQMVKEKLEKWYGVNIHVSDMKKFCNWNVDGQYDNQSLELVLTHISYTKNFEFRIKEKEVYIKK
jgi:ferric-dicitrate binding protein FerR (iron transport regulator)